MTRKKQHTGILFVVSAPSGAGKTTLLKRVMRRLPGISFSVSHTTRSPRADEKNGVDYHFVDRSHFVEIRDREPCGFLEWAEVHGNLYGTARAAVQEKIGRGEDIVLDIDVQGARQVRALLETVSLFIAPPSMEELARRLKKRGTDSDAAVALRLENARRELDAIPEYDYLIVNDRLERAAETLRAIIIAERCRRRRDMDGRRLDIHALG